MSQPIERPVPVYVNDDKIAEVKSGSFSVNPNASRQYGADETAIAFGVVECDMDIETIWPVAGMKTALLAMLISQTLVTVQLYLDGQFYTFSGAISMGSSKWDTEKGTNEGSFKFIGTAPLAS